MISRLFSNRQKAKTALFGLCLFFYVLGPFGAAAEEVIKPGERLPGLNEVIPQSTAVAAKATETQSIIDQTKSLEKTYFQLNALSEQLKELEAEYVQWDDTINWPLNRLMTAEVQYSQIDQAQKDLLDQLSKQISIVDELRISWTKEKYYWSNWKKNLREPEGGITGGAFNKTLKSIDETLQKISTAATGLLKKQEEFSSTRGIITSRLSLIKTTLGQLREETFRRNAYSLFSDDFYRQLTPDLFDEYQGNISSNLMLPADFWQRHGWVVGLQLILILGLASLLTKRRNDNKPISTDWRFLFKHPLSGATFITLITTGAFYEQTSPSWEWVILTLAIISGTVLVAAMAENARRRRLINALAVVYLVSETLKVSGMPSPAYQLYEVLLCALVAPVCLMLAKRKRRQEPDRFGIYVASLYLISLIAMIGLVTALLGFVTLSIHLVDAMLGTIIILFMVRMAIHLADGGITEFMRLNWVRGRALVLKLGISTAERLKTLARIFILVNAGLFTLVVWGVYNNLDEAATSILTLEYTIGEFSISVHMVVMLILVLYLTNLLSWAFQAFTDAYYLSPKNVDYGVKAAIKRLLHYALFTIGFFVAISMAGLDLQKFTIIAGALGVGIGFGLQNIVNNFVSGLILLFERPVKVGDTINIDDQWGTIVKIGLRSTVFETLDRAEIIVPNSDLIAHKVTNWTFTTNISRVVLSVGVAYGSPLEKVLEILNLVAKENPDIIKDPEPSAIFTDFGESSIDFELRVWISDISKRLKIKSDLGQAIDTYFRKEGITIPFPQRDLHLKSIDPDLKTALDSQMSSERNL